MEPGSCDGEPGTALAMVPVSASSSPLSPACLVYASTLAGPGPDFQSTGSIYLFPHGWRALVSQQAPTAPYGVLGARLPFPFTVLTAATSVSTAPTPPVGLPALSLHEMPILRPPRLSVMENMTAVSLCLSYFSCLVTSNTVSIPLVEHVL